MTNLRLKVTLIELLVVVAIIGILASLLMPSLALARYKGRNLLCLNRQRQLTVAVALYCGDNNSLFPDRGMNSGGSEPLWARWAMRRQLGAGQVLDDMLDDYIAERYYTWVCPLYKYGAWPYAGANRCPTGGGGKYGCHDHGISHNGDPDRKK